MKKDWEIYRDTGILGGYIPEQAKLRRTEDGEVATADGSASRLCSQQSPAQRRRTS